MVEKLLLRSGVCVIASRTFSAAESIVDPTVIPSPTEIRSITTVSTKKRLSFSSLQRVSLQREALPFVHLSAL